MDDTWHNQGFVFREISEMQMIVTLLGTDKEEMSPFLLLLLLSLFLHILYDRFGVRLLRLSMV